MISQDIYNEYKEIQVYFNAMKKEQPHFYKYLNFDLDIIDMLLQKVKIKDISKIKNMSKQAIYLKISQIRYFYKKNKTIYEYNIRTYIDNKNK